MPAVGYHIDSGDGSLVFTGDTTICDALWMEVNKIKNLKHIIIETAFSNSEFELAKLSKHLCPSMLVTELAKLKPYHNLLPEIFITHLKPGEGTTIMQEISANEFTFKLQALQNHQVFEL